MTICFILRIFASRLLGDSDREKFFLYILSLIMSDLVFELVLFWKSNAYSKVLCGFFLFFFYLKKIVVKIVLYLFKPFTDYFIWLLIVIELNTLKQMVSNPWFMTSYWSLNLQIRVWCDYFQIWIHTWNENKNKEKWKLIMQIIIK